MGASLSKLRSLADAVFGTPNPANVRRYGLHILLFLSLPKYAWDYYRFRQLLTTSRNAHDDPNKAKDPVKTVLFNACTKSMEQFSNAWNLVLMPYCSDATNIQDQVEQFFSTVNVRLSELQPANVSFQAITEATETTEDDAQLLVFKADEIPDDALLGKWRTTLNTSCKGPLTKALDLEVEDYAAEEELRELARALQYLSSMFEDLLHKTRSDVALKLFEDALQLQEHDRQNDGGTWPPTNIQLLEEDQLIWTLDGGDTRQDALQDLVNRKRAKVLFLSEKIGFYHHYRIAPDVLRVAIKEQGIESSIACISQDHIDLWTGLQNANDNEFYGKEKNRAARERQNKIVIPNHEGHKFLIAMNTALAIHCTMTTTKIDIKLGGIRRQRIWKLIQFCWNDLLGSWHQRVLTGIGWVLAAVSQSVKCVVVVVFSIMFSSFLGGSLTQ